MGCTSFKAMNTIESINEASERIEAKKIAVKMTSSLSNKETNFIESEYNKMKEVLLDSKLEIEKKQMKCGGNDTEIYVRAKRCKRIMKQYEQLLDKFLEKR